MTEHNIEQVCVGGVVVRRHASRNEVCLILRDRHGPRTWNLPKGHVEPGEELSGTALREVREETGLSGHIVKTLPSIHYEFTLPGDLHRYAKTVHFFLIRFSEGDTRAHDAEALEVRWVPIEEAITMLEHENEQNVLRAARTILAQQSS